MLLSGEWEWIYVESRVPVEFDLNILQFTLLLKLKGTSRSQFSDSYYYK